MIENGDIQDNTNLDSIDHSQIEEVPKKVTKKVSIDNIEKYEEKIESDTETRYRLNKEKKKMYQLEARRKNFKAKKLQSKAKSSSKGFRLNKRIKLIDLIIGLLIIANFSISLYENDQYTTENVKVVCHDPTLRNLNDNSSGYLPTSSLDHSNFSSVDNQVFRYLGSNGTVYVPPKPTPHICINSTSTIIKQKYELTDFINIMRLLIISIIILNEILLIYRYILRLNLMREKYLACDDDGLISTGLFWPLVVEFAVLGVCIPPYLQGTLSGNMMFGYYIYSYDSIINLFQVFKFYYFVKIAANFSVWTGDYVKSIGIEKRVDIGLMFALKAQIRNRPAFTILILMAISVSILGFMFRIFELGYISNPGDQRTQKVLVDQINGYADVYWFILISMTTVGYGDIYPNTHLGRLIAIISIFIGMILLSLFVVSLKGMIDFSPEEGIAHASILKMLDHEKMEKFSTVYVKAFMKLFLLKKSEWYLSKNAIDRKPLPGIRTYVEQLLIVKEFSVKFTKYQKIASSHSVPADIVLTKLHKKLENDMDLVGPNIYVLEDMNTLTNKIIENENQIKNGLGYLKEKQDDLVSYLIKFNTIKSSVDMIEKENSENQGNSDLI